MSERPAYHLTPERHWLNDPNGLIHHGGRWHAFFQHNPEGIDWGHMSWGHTSSADLVHWREHPVALRWTPTEQAFSGSAVEDRDGSLVLVYTSVDTATGRQAQSLARSTDGGESFQRYADNPVLDRGSQDFRDPKVFAHDGGWVMVAVEAMVPAVVLYRSEDLVTWTLLSQWTPEWPVSVQFECPDLFALADDDGTERWVLLLSLTAPDVPFPEGRGTAWYVGDFDGTTFTATSQGWLDHGPDCYAGVTFNQAPDGRRVLLAWMSTWAYAADVPTEPWRGSMTLPRELSLCGGQLRQRPVAEVAAYARRLALAPGESVELEGARLSRSGAELVLERPGPAFHPAFPWTARAPIAEGPEPLEVDVFVDATSIEVFTAEGDVAITVLVMAGHGRSWPVMAGATA